MDLLDLIQSTASNNGLDFNQDIKILEQVQSRATRMIPGISHLSYKDRLKELNLFTLTYRRLNQGRSYSGLQNNERFR